MLVFYLFSWLFNTPLNITEEERKNQDSLLEGCLLLFRTIVI